MKNWKNKIGSCGCDGKKLYQVWVYWGIDQKEQFMYCVDCIKEDQSKGMKVDIIEDK